MLVMGVDPGTARLGYGLVTSKGTRAAWVAHGCLTPPAKASPAERLLYLAENLRQIIRTHSPEVVSVEKLFFSRNVTTAIAVGQARGVALLAATLFLGLFAFTLRFLVRSISRRRLIGVLGIAVNPLFQLFGAPSQFFQAGRQLQDMVFQSFDVPANGFRGSQPLVIGKCSFDMHV